LYDLPNEFGFNGSEFKSDELIT